MAKSAGEAELIAQNIVGDLVEWACEMLQELGYAQKKVNSTCANANDNAWDRLF